MKSKLLISLAVIAALIVGFFLGRFYVRHSLQRHYMSIVSPEIRRAAADFSHAAGLLKAIRSGDTNEVIQTLEEDLDSNILLIGAAVEATPVSERDGQWLSRIRWLRDYRIEHPRKSDPFIDGEVAHILSLVETNR